MTTKTFSPGWCPHVVGTYEENDGEFEQKYSIVCNKCGATWGPTICNSGLVRQHIGNFALAHIHRDPLLEPFPSPNPPKE
jgi:hypothetical protein